jgi:HEAT repeat protein
VDAVYALGKVKPAARNAIFQLLKTLQDSSPKVRNEVIWALFRIDPESTEVIQAHVKALAAINPNYVRETSVKAIDQLGPKAKEAVPYWLKIDSPQAEKEPSLSSSTFS